MVEFAPKLINNEENTFAPKLITDETTNRVTLENEPPPQTEESTFADIAQGVFSGIIRGGAVEPAKTGLTLLQAKFGGPDQAKELEKTYQKFQEYTGLKPDKTGGEVSERITGFLTSYLTLGKVLKGAKSLMGIKAPPPSIGAFRKLSPTQRVIQAGKTSFRGGAAEFLSSPDGAMTLSDSFDALPDALKTDNEVKIDSRDEAKRRLANKLKLGTEATAFGLAVEAAFPVVGITVKSASKLNLPFQYKGYQLGVGGVVKGLSDGIGFLGANINKALGRLPERYLTSAGVTPKEIYEQLQDTVAVTKADADKVANTLSSFDRELKKVVKAQGLFGRGRLGIQEAHDNLYDYLSGANVNALDQYGQGVKTAAKSLRTQIDDMSDLIATDIGRRIDLGEIDATRGQQLINTINEQKGSYIRRVYEGAFSKGETLADIKLKPEYAESVRKLAARFPEDENAVARATQVIDDAINDNAVNLAIPSEETVKSVAKGLKFADNFFGRKPLYEVMEGIFKDRDKFLYGIPEFRTLVKEIKDPVKVAIRTIEDMSTTLNASRLYSSLSTQLKSTAEQGLSSLRQGGRPLIISGENLTDTNSINFLRQNGYVKLDEYVPQKPIGSVLDDASDIIPTDVDIEKMSIFGGKYGALSGDYVAPEIYNSLTMPLRGNSIFNDLLGITLQLKGLSQYSKTVLNPLAQVRNFMSGPFFLLANGVVARNMNLGESMALTFKKYDNLSSEEFKKFFDTFGRLGLRDENLAIKEIEEIAKDGGKFNFLNAIEKVPGAKPLQKIYMNTDTYWKMNAFSGEKARYSAAFNKAGIVVDDIADELIATRIIKRPKGEVLRDVDTLDVLVGDIVKETMPIYSRVPEAIKLIRKVPIVGAFASFPAEIIRNSANILARGVDEMSFIATPEIVAKVGTRAAKELEKQIRAIGAQRIAGYISSAFVVPKAIVSASAKAAGISEEQLEEIRINNLPEFMRGQLIAALSPITKDKRGDYNLEYTSISYLMPYDFVLQPARAALDAYNRKGFLDAQSATDIISSAFQAFGTFMEPFAGESLLAERIFDVTLRDGNTDTGIKVYSQGDSLGGKLKKGLVHVFNGLNPAILENTFFKPTARGPGGELSIEFGRTGKAFTQSITGEILPTKTGVVYEGPAEALTTITGVRALKANFNDSLYYKTNEYTKKRNALRTDFNSYADDNDLTKQQIVAASNAANNTLYKLQQDMYRIIKGARDLGIDEATIYEMITEKGTMSKSEFQMISEGSFLPFNVTDDLVERILRDRLIRNEPGPVRELPVDELLDAYENVLGKSLIGASDPKESPTGVFDQKNEKPTFAPKLMQSQPVDTRPVTINTFAPKLISPQTTSPSLLGGNIVDQAKNLEILRRRTQ